MPYIKPELRPKLDDHMKRLCQVIKTPGELNYVISKLLNDMLEYKEIWSKKWGYEDVNAFVGALECAKLELYRRVISPYEDLKIKENGDVYNLHDTPSE